MAKDFRSNQIRFSKLIASGAISATLPHLGLLVYSSSKATNFDGTNSVNSGNLTAAHGIGNDVWMLVDGTPDINPTARGFSNGSTVLFLGNVAVSGTLRAGRSTVEVSNTVPSGRFIAVRDFAAGDSLALSKSDGRGGMQDAPPPGVGLVVDNANRVFAFDVVSGSTSGSNRTSIAALSFPEYNTSDQGKGHADVNFHVGGRIGSRGENTLGPGNTVARGTALFDGDLVVSGNLKTHGSFSFTPLFDEHVILDNETPLTPQLQFKNNGTQHGSIGMHNASMRIAATGSTGGVDIITDAGNSGGKRVIFDDGHIGMEAEKLIMFTSASDAQVYPSIGQASGQVRMYLKDGDFYFLNQGTTKENVKVLSNVPIEFVEYENDNDPGQAKGIRFEGPFSPKKLGSINSLSYQKDSVSGSAENALTLKSTDSAIRVQANAGKIILSASAGVEITSNLNVLGAVVSIETYNAEVKDPVILMASGAVSSNQNGGIAIASGSSVSNQALVFGRVANDTWGVGRKDVDQGRAVDLSDMVLTNFRTAKAEFGAATESVAATNNTLQLSGSAISFKPEVPIFFDEQRHTKLFVSASDRTVALESDQALKLELRSESSTVAGPYINFIQGGAEGPTVYRGTSAARDNFFIKNTVGKTHIYSQMNFGADVKVMAGLPDAGARQRQYVMFLSQSHEQGNATSETEPTGFAIFGGYSNDSHDVSGVDAWILSGSEQKDVAFFVSGAIGCVNKVDTDRDIRGAAVFGGDLVVSGNFYPGGGVLKVQAVRVNPLDHVPAPGYLRFGTDSGGDEASFEIARDSGHLKFKDTASPAAGTGYTLTQLAALAVVDDTDVFAVTAHDGNSPFLSYAATTGSFSFDHNPRTNGYTARRTNQIGDDVYFFVSGSANNSGKDWDGAWRGAAVFGGDIVTSGSLITNTLKVEVDGNGSKISQRSGNGDIKFFVDKAAGGTLVEAMRLTNGGANLQLGADSNSDSKLAFALEANAYIQFVNGGGSPNTLKIVTDENADDKIQLTTGTGDTAAAGGTIEVRGDVVPTANNQFNLGSSSNRWANVYTGDLHLRNERGDWTIVEESDYLCVVNNLTGKKYKMMLEPIGDNE